MIFLERDHNIGVIGAQSPVRQMLCIHRTIRKADVVEDVVQFLSRNLLANILFDQVAETGHLFNTHS